jgi:hypothetical protein
MKLVDGAKYNEKYNIIEYCGIDLGICLSRQEVQNTIKICIVSKSTKAKIWTPTPTYI